LAALVDLTEAGLWGALVASFQELAGALVYGRDDEGPPFDELRRNRV
jgi:hypothetical protein